jgi:hypothetical protein
MERLHTPNEFIRIRRLREGVRAWEELWRLLADGPQRFARREGDDGGGEELADLRSVVHPSTVNDRDPAWEVPALPVRAGTPTGARTRVDWFS